jgi:hypothetical protein
MKVGLSMFYVSTATPEQFNSIAEFLPQVNGEVFMHVFHV